METFYNSRKHAEWYAFCLFCKNIYLYKYFLDIQTIRLYVQNTIYLLKIIPNTQISPQGIRYTF